MMILLSLLLFLATCAAVALLLERGMILSMFLAYQQAPAQHS